MQQFVALQFGRRAVALFAGAAVLVFCAGAAARLGFFRKDADDVRNDRNPEAAPPQPGDPNFAIDNDEPEWNRKGNP